MNFTFQITNWNNHRIQLQTIRESVFIQEQKVPIELEWDGLDDNASHVLAETLSHGKKYAIGTARILITENQAHIGRMAVLEKYRNHGIGTGILQCCINECKRLALKTIILNAQVYVIEFYQKQGFEISSEEFLDAGIPHKQMMLTLKDES